MPTLVHFIYILVKWILSLVWGSAVQTSSTVAVHQTPAPVLAYYPSVYITKCALENAWALMCWLTVELVDQECKTIEANVGMLIIEIGVGEKILGWFGKELLIVEFTLSGRAHIFVDTEHLLESKIREITHETLSKVLKDTPCEYAPLYVEQFHTKMCTKIKRLKVSIKMLLYSCITQSELQKVLKESESGVQILSWWKHFCSWQNLYFVSC